MIRALLVASAAALAAGVAGVLALDAAARTWGQPAAAMLVALTAVWLTQSLLFALLITRRIRSAEKE